MYNHQEIVLLEPNLRSPSGHYADFVRAVGSCAKQGQIAVYADPAADEMLAAMPGITVSKQSPRVGERLAEWRTLFRLVASQQPFLVLTADARHAAALSVAAKACNKSLRNARLFFHRTPTTPRDRLLLPLTEPAKAYAHAITPTEEVANWLRSNGWQRVSCIPYPVLTEHAPPSPAPFRHLLMAGAARINKGLDIVADMAVQWADQNREIPLLVQVSTKHAGRHGRREAGVVETLLNSGYRGLRADESAPERSEYLERFTGALVLAPYAREQFASQVSGVVLDALLHGAPVIATKGTWPGAQVERFGAGLTIAERTPEALSAAIDQIQAGWESYTEKACHAARILADEHRPIHLLNALLAAP